MTTKKITAAIVGCLLTINYGGVLTPHVFAQDIEYRNEESFVPGDEFTQEIRKEHDLHEQNVQTIRNKYPDPEEINLLNEEMKTERNRHVQRMREIHRQYYNSNFAQE